MALFWKIYLLLFALLIIFQAGLGLYMTNLDFYHRWYHLAPLLHKSTGVVIFLMGVLRFVYHLKRKVPPFPVILKSFKYNALGVRQIALYPMLLVITFSGYLFSTSKGDPVMFFGLFGIPSAFRFGDRMIEILDRVHLSFAYILLLMIAVHSLQKIYGRNDKKL